MLLSGNHYDGCPFRAAVLSVQRQLILSRKRSLLSPLSISDPLPAGFTLPVDLIDRILLDHQIVLSLHPVGRVYRAPMIPCLFFFHFHNKSISYCLQSIPTKFDQGIFMYRKANTVKTLFMICYAIRSFSSLSFKNFRKLSKPGYII